MMLMLLPPSHYYYRSVRTQGPVASRVLKACEGRLLGCAWRGGGQRDLMAGAVDPLLMTEIQHLGWLTFDKSCGYSSSTRVQDKEAYKSGV